VRVEVAHLGVDVGVAFFSWIDTDMVRGADARHPAFGQLRSELRGPAGRTLPVAEAGAVLVDAVAHRRRTVVAPRIVRVAYWLRGVIGPIVDRDARRNAAAIDAATVEMVAERGAYDAAMGPAAGAAAPSRSLEH
jgi:hypothetical protein